MLGAGKKFPWGLFARMRTTLKGLIGWWRNFRRRTEGVAAVEFAILASVLFLIIGGVLDFGHAWYMEQVINNAAQDGARYAACYQQDSSANRMALANFNPSIQTFTTNLLVGLNATVTPSGPGWTNSPPQHGDNVTVTVSVPMTWFMLAGFLPAGTLPSTLTAKVTVPLE
jgi:Flp pilus assembly protein TadG